MIRPLALLVLLAALLATATAAEAASPSVRTDHLQGGGPSRGDVQRHSPVARACRVWTRQR